jgi:hypothetical protein
MKQQRMQRKLKEKRAQKSKERAKIPSVLWNFSSDGES